MPENRFTLSVLAGCALIIVLAVFVPRSMAYMPALLGLIAFAAWPLSHPSIRPWSRPALIAVVVIIGLALFSALWSDDVADAAQRALKLLIPLAGGALLFGLLPHLNRPLFLRLWWVLPLVTAICCAVHTMEYGMDYPVYRLIRHIDAEIYVSNYELNRPSVILAVLAPLMTTLVFLGLRASTTLNRSRLGAGLYALVFLPLVIVTEAQSAQLALVAGMFVLLLWPINIRWLWRGIAALYCMVLLTLPFIVPPFFSSLPPVNYSSANPGWQNSANVMPRLEVWDYISRYALQRPLNGFGFEATRRVENFDNHELYQPGKTVLHPHNAILQVWIEFGLIGIVLACAAGVFSLLRVAAMTYSLQRHLALSTMASLAGVGLVGFGLWQGWWLGLIVFSAALTALLCEIVAYENRRVI